MKTEYVNVASAESSMHAVPARGVFVDEPDRLPCASLDEHIAHKCGAAQGQGKHVPAGAGVAHGDTQAAIVALPNLDLRVWLRYHFVIPMVEAHRHGRLHLAPDDRQLVDQILELLGVEGLAVQADLCV